MELPVKERLVGAAILVGLIVVLVPEMLSGPKDAQTTGGTTDGGALRTYTIDLSTPGQAAHAPPPVAEAVPEPTRVPVEPQSPPQAVIEPEPPKPEPAQSEQPEQKPIGASVTSGWAVQLGSFASAENAKKLVTELRAKGYEAFISSIGSGPKARHRVRVGPTATRPQADKLAQRLKSEDRQVAVVSHP